MAIITLPASFAFRSVEGLKLQRATNTIRSMFTGARQTVLYPFAVWQIEGELVDAEGANAAAIRSFLVQLEGQANTFRLPVPGVDKPTTGYSGPEGTVRLAAAARAQSVEIQELTPNVPYLNDGDYITINDELKVVVGSVAVNSLGRAVVAFKPGLRKAATVDMATQVRNPTVMLHANDDDVAKWAISRPVIHSFKGVFIEAIDV